MKNHDVRIINGLELCMYTSKNHADSKMLHLEGDNNNMSNSPVENYNGSIVIKVLFFILKFCFCAIDLLIDCVTNKWTWSLMYLVVNVVMDIFFHLVLASAAVMVVFILNVDDFYQQVKDDELKSLNAIAQDEKLINILEKETCPNLV
ncbi:hypothetical protein QE152_g15154 [Popillia japonica]|uniref:Uncharacterized protein n=1 Tax=Popillia japonica TaxID=7064 RepID=A0AAW1L8Y3_POPJA